MTSFSNINKVRSILDEVNGVIETTLLLTRDDISKIMSMLKAMDERDADTMSAVIHDLQNFDVFEQRLRHIIEINLSVPLNEYGATNGAVHGINIFRLNQLQYEAAWSDYMLAITQLKSAIASRHQDASIHLDFASTGILTKAAMHLTSDKFEKVIALTDGQRVALLERYQNSIQQVYSTERERMLLTLLCNNPKVTLQDISLSLITNENNDSSIDLF